MRHMPRRSLLGFTFQCEDFSFRIGEQKFTLKVYFESIFRVGVELQSLVNCDNAEALNRCTFRAEGLLLLLGKVFVARKNL